MAPCMRHVLLGIFNPSCCEMNGEYILTLYLLGSIIFWKFAKGFSLCSLEFQDKSCILMPSGRVRDALVRMSQVFGS